MSLTRRALLSSASAAAVSFGGAERVFGQEIKAGQVLESRLNAFQLTRENGAVWDKSQNHVVIPSRDQSVMLSTGGFVLGDRDFRPEKDLSYIVLASGKGTLAVSDLEPGNYYAQQLNGVRPNRNNFLGSVKNALHNPDYGNSRVQVVLVDLPTGDVTVLEANRDNIDAKTSPGEIPQKVTFVDVNNSPNIGPRGQRNPEVAAKAAPFAEIEVALSGPAHFWASEVQENLKRGRSIAQGETSAVLATADNNNVFYLSVGHIKLGESNLPFADGNPFLVLVKGSHEVVAENLAGGYVQEIAAPLASKLWFSDQVRYALYTQGAEKAYVGLYDGDSGEMQLYVADKSVVAANSGEEILDMLTPVAIPQEGKTVEDLKPLKGVPTDAQVVVKSNGERPKRLPTTVTTESIEVELGPGKVVFLTGGHMSIPFFGANLTHKNGRTHTVVLHSEFPFKATVSGLSPRNATVNVIEGDSVNADWLMEQVQHPQAPGQTDITVLNVGQNNVTARWEIDKSSVNAENPYGVWNNPVDAPQSRQEAKATVKGLPKELDYVLSVDGGYPKEGPKTLSGKEAALNLQPGTVKVVIGGHYVATGKEQELDLSQWREKQVYVTIFRADETRDVKLTNYPEGHTIVIDVPADKANPQYLRNLVKVITDRGENPVVGMYQVGRENFVAAFDGKTWARIK